LHDCDIFHADIKGENILVYNDSNLGTAENWQAKISDFGNAILLNEEELKKRPLSEVRIRGGTLLYDAPEVNANQDIGDWQSLKYADIWSFGLLALEILSGGTELQELVPIARNVHSDRRHEIILKHCEEELLRAHPWDQTLIEVALHLGKNCLDLDPFSRPSARNLLAYLQDKKVLLRRFDLSPTAHNPRTLTRLEDLPPFDLKPHYYDLQSTLTVPRHIFRDLHGQVASELTLSIRRHAEFQLGLCYASAFGHVLDKDKAILHVTSAAKSGSLEAQALLPRLYGALGVRVENGSTTELCSWLDIAWRNGSITALQDLQTLGERNGPSAKLELFTPIQPRKNRSGQLLKLPQIHKAVLAGNVDKVAHHAGSSVAINTQGPCGEVALHYCICLPASLGYIVATELLKNGASISQATSAPIFFSEHAFILNQIDAGMTPLELAISHDRIDLVRLFMEFKDHDVSEENLMLATRYSSISCLEYLLTDTKWIEYSKDVVKRFDRYNFSVMYYACRPDFFDRLYRFQPSIEIVPTVPHGCHAITTKEIKIVDLLLQFGASLQVHKENSFNVFHLLASFGDSTLLDRLLSSDKAKLLKDERSDYGWTPLKDAIGRGRHEAFDCLLKHHVTMKNIWELNTSRIHALHVCSLYPGLTAVSFAEKILKLDPSSIRARDSAGDTPLHKAAKYGRIHLIRVLVKNKASLKAVNNLRITPLGSAILFRETSAIQELRRSLQKRSLPEVSWYGRGTFYRYPIHPIEQLVSAGWHSTTKDLNLDARTYIGACDHPFSDASVALLKKLLDDFPPRIKFGANFRQSALYHPIHSTGIHAAIRMANCKATKLIICRVQETSYLSASQLRLLLFLALAQLSMNNMHIASLKEREEMVSDIWVICEKTFYDKRKQRLDSPVFLKTYWKVFYRFYGDKEHQQLSLTKIWIEENPRQIFRDGGLWPHQIPLDEFHQWHSSRISLTSLNMLLLVLIEIPTITFLVIIAIDPASEWSLAKTAWAIIASLLVSGSKYQHSLVTDKT
jgi:serine/threonine protein kinase/ankyrin repeat protein